MLNWFVAMAVIVGAPALKDKPTSQYLYGEWEAEAPSKDADGNEVAGRLRLHFNKDGTRQMFRPNEDPGVLLSFTFNPKSSPPTIDLKSLSDSPKLTSFGIYRIEADRLTICYAFPGKSRPTEFAEKPSGAAYLQHFRRVKPKD